MPRVVVDKQGRIGKLTIEMPALCHKFKRRKLTEMIAEPASLSIEKMSDTKKSKGKFWLRVREGKYYTTQVEADSKDLREFAEAVLAHVGE